MVLFIWVLWSVLTKKQAAIKPCQDEVVMIKNNILTWMFYVSVIASKVIFLFSLFPFLSLYPTQAVFRVYAWLCTHSRITPGELGRRYVVLGKNPGQLSNTKNPNHCTIYLDHSFFFSFVHKGPLYCLASWKYYILHQYLLYLYFWYTPGDARVYSWLWAQGSFLAGIRAH